MNTVQHVDNDGKPIKEAGTSAAIMHYCKYQERCHWEVKNKLFDLGCSQAEAEDHLSVLIEKGVVNEERFARAYAGGKFRMKQWGRQKIRQQLKQRRISDYCIRKGLAEIDEEEYAKTLAKLTNSKLSELKSERNQSIVKFKLYRYLVQKGYETDLSLSAINECMPGKK